jgi:hypothetical protein
MIVMLSARRLSPARGTSSGGLGIPGAVDARRRGPRPHSVCSQRKRIKRSGHLAAPSCDAARRSRSRVVAAVSKRHTTASDEIRSTGQPSGCCGGRQLVARVDSSAFRRLRERRASQTRALARLPLARCGSESRFDGDARSIGFDISRDGRLSCASARASGSAVRSAQRLRRLDVRQGPVGQPPQKYGPDVGVIVIPIPAAGVAARAPWARGGP